MQYFNYWAFHLSFKFDVRMNCTLYLNELQHIISTVRIRSSHTYEIDNQVYSIQDEPPAIGNNIVNSNSRRDMISILESYIYRVFHCRQKNTNHQAFYNLKYFDDRDFVETISNANKGIGTWEPGWEIHKILDKESNRLIVKKNGLMIWVNSHQFIPNDLSGYDLGQKGYVSMVKEFRELLSGFYMANGNISLKENVSITRLYWNISSDGAIPIMETLTTELNDSHIPFQFKILSNSNYFTRADAAVLYFDKQNIKDMVLSLSKIYVKVKPFLKSATPLFAKKLASGLSLAEDPNNGESFGQNRSRILAEALYKIYDNRALSVTDQMLQINEHFDKNNIDVEKPYLKNNDSIDNYDEIIGVLS